MKVDLTQFTNAVFERLPKHFLDLGEAPNWLKSGLSEVSSLKIETNLSVLLSSDTAEVKLRKHFARDGLENLLEVIAFSLTSITREVREAKYPSAIEVYFLMEQKLWIAVFKYTTMNEIIVSTVHRTDARNLKASRQQRFLHGTHIEY
jgi:hypothetical protein